MSQSYAILVVLLADKTLIYVWALCLMILQFHYVQKLCVQQNHTNIKTNKAILNQEFDVSMETFTQ